MCLKYLMSHPHLRHLPPRSPCRSRPGRRGLEGAGTPWHGTPQRWLPRS